MFPAKEITAMENNETMIKSRSPVVKKQVIDLQTFGSLSELLAVVLFILAGYFQGWWSLQPDDSSNL